MVKLATAVTVAAVHNTRQRTTTLVASAGPLKAETRPFGGRYSPDQAKLAWLRQPTLFEGDTDLLRLLPVAA